MWEPGSLACKTVFGSRTAAHVAIAMSRKCMWQPDPNQDKRWVNGPTMWALCSWNVLIVMQMQVFSLFVSNGSTSYKITPETWANTHRSLGTRPRHDYTHCVMLNNFVSARWSPMYQYLVLTSLRDNSHLLPIREPGKDRRLFFSLPYFHFRTSVSVSEFSTCPFHWNQNCP